MANNSSIDRQQEMVKKINEVLMTVDGVSHTVGNVTDDIAKVLKRNDDFRGIEIEKNEDGIIIKLSIKTIFGYTIPKVAQNIQKEIKESIENDFEIKVDEVDINVMGLTFENK